MTDKGRCEQDKDGIRTDNGGCEQKKDGIRTHNGGCEKKKDGIACPSVQMASKQNWTTKRMTHSNKLYDLVEDIKMGTAIAVSDGSYDPVTKICSVACTIELETGDQ